VKQLLEEMDKLNTLGLLDICLDILLFQLLLDQHLWEERLNIYELERLDTLLEKGRKDRL